VGRIASLKEEAEGSETEEVENREEVELRLTLRWFSDFGGCIVRSVRG